MQTVLKLALAGGEQEPRSVRRRCRQTGRSAHQVQGTKELRILPRVIDQEHCWRPEATPQNGLKVESGAFQIWLTWLGCVSDYMSSVSSSQLRAWAIISNLAPPTLASCADALSSSRNDSSPTNLGIVAWRAQSVCAGGCSSTCPPRFP